MFTVAVNEFARRHKPESELSHFEGSEEELCKLVQKAYADGHTRKGYRDGVILVTVPPAEFFCAHRTLKPGEQYFGVFAPRREGEEPRKKSFVLGEKSPAKVVEIVLYRADVLEESGDRTADTDYEVISINARAQREPEPIGLGALLNNHFEGSGGTKSNMTDEEFIKTLRESFLYWKDKVSVRPMGSDSL